MPMGSAIAPLSKVRHQKIGASPIKGLMKRCVFAWAGTLNVDISQSRFVWFPLRFKDEHVSIDWRGGRALVGGDGMNSYMQGECHAQFGLTS